MAAMEVFYKDYPPETVERAASAPREKHDLLPLGGSDYHGIFGNDEPLPGNIPLPDSSIERLLERAAHAAQSRARVVARTLAESARPGVHRR